MIIMLLSLAGAWAWAEHGNYYLMLECQLDRIHILKKTDPLTPSPCPVCNQIYHQTCNHLPRMFETLLLSADILFGTLRTLPGQAGETQGGDTQDRVASSIQHHRETCKQSLSIFIIYTSICQKTRDIGVHRYIAIYFAILCFQHRPANYFPTELTVLG